MSTKNNFYRLLMAADSAAVRNKDKVLGKEVDEMWQRVIGERVSGKRCTRSIVSGKLRARCLLGAEHRGACQTWISIKHVPGKFLDVSEAVAKEVDETIYMDELEYQKYEEECEGET